MTEALVRLIKINFFYIKFKYGKLKFSDER